AGKAKENIESLEEQLAAFEKRYSEAPQSTPNAQGAGSYTSPECFVCMCESGKSEIRFLVDTGSDVTVISVQEFETIFNHNTITLSKEDTSFKTAN
ncbi:hypothetical protein ScPMuIL_002110, partial [Solemya velum]